MLSGIKSKNTNLVAAPPGTVRLCRRKKIYSVSKKQEEWEFLTFSFG
jgi:hypothetical protein